LALLKWSEVPLLHMKFRTSGRERHGARWRVGSGFRPNVLLIGLLAVGFSILMVASVAIPVSAVIGQDDSEDLYPFVGLMAYQPVEGGPWYVARGGSATLVSPSVAVVAAHVISMTPAGPTFFFGFHPHAMGVVFHPRPLLDLSTAPDPDAVAAFPRGLMLREISEDHVHKATPFVHPDFASLTSDSGRIQNDLGVLVFDVPVSEVTATISPEQSAGELLRQVRAHGGKITLVGYGAGDVRPPSFPEDGRRRVADLTVKHITNAELWAWKVDETDGGSAPGDSGSPAFLKGTSIVVGVLSTATIESRFVSGFSRTGSTSACQFLADFLDDLSCSP